MNNLTKQIYAQILESLSNQTDLTEATKKLPSLDINNPNHALKLVKGHFLGQNKLTDKQISQIARNPDAHEAQAKLAAEHYDEPCLESDDVEAIAHNKNASDAHEIIANMHADRRHRISPGAISAICKANSPDAHERFVIAAREGNANLRPDDVRHIVKNEDSTEAHKEIVNSHNRDRKNKIPLSEADKEKLRSYGHTVK